MPESTIPQSECKHVVGFWHGVDEGGLISDTPCDRKLYNDLVDEWFKFCPRCGMAMMANEN